jgi:hypothetical protein
VAVPHRNPRGKWNEAVGKFSSMMIGARHIPLWE